MKIIAMYLPQYHQIKENDEWWGEGYTEWTAVKNAKRYFAHHDQPRRPLNNNYYDLSDVNATTWRWQAEIAKKYGIYGFCIYHYWFKTGEQLLEKPMEILLAHPEIDINYCMCWANETWRRTWYGVKNDVLKEQTYGDKEEWISHFNYMLKFFKDNRYIKIDNKPVICIYRSVYIDKLKEMRKLWDELALQNGFSGVYIISGNTGQRTDYRDNIVDAYYNYEPMYTYSHKLPANVKMPILIKREIKKIVNNYRKKKVIQTYIIAKKIYKHNYTHLYYKNKKCFLGSFVGFDDSPRRQYKGTIYKSTPKEFCDNLKKIATVLSENKRQNDFVFVTAWNEWGEGAYLEPDETNGYAYLEALKSAIDECQVEK